MLFYAYENIIYPDENIIYPNPLNMLSYIIRKIPPKKIRRNVLVEKLLGHEIRVYWYENSIHIFLTNRYDKTIAYTRVNVC